MSCTSGPGVVRIRGSSKLKVQRWVLYLVKFSPFEQRLGFPNGGEKDTLNQSNPGSRSGSRVLLVEVHYSHTERVRRMLLRSGLKRRRWSILRRLRSNGALAVQSIRAGFLSRAKLVESRP